MRVLRAAGHREMPWKNGGGATREIAAWPEGAPLDAFGWRLSMARVARDGPFSMFPGIDRSLCVLEGGRLLLEFADGARLCVEQGGPPLRFPADVPVTGRIPDGPILDLNVMTSRGAFSHRVRRIGPNEPADIPCAGLTTLILVHGAARAGDLALAMDDVIVLSRDSRVALVAEGDESCVFVVDILEADKA